MKSKIILSLIPAVLLSAGAVWVTSHSAYAADSAVTAPKLLYYTCPMHTSVRADKPGTCSICGMTLQPVYEKPAGTNVPPATVTTNEAASMMPGCCPSGGCR